MLTMVRPPALGPEVTQPVDDIRSWVSLRTPVDDIHGAILTRLQAAAQMTPLPEAHMSIYGFTNQDLATQLALLARNPASRFVFDKTQGAGRTEAPILGAFEQAVPAAQRVVGTSPVAGAILHAKVIALLYPDGSGWTVTGSFNFSASAQQQFNIVDLIESTSRAQLFRGWIDDVFNWVQAHEPQAA